jgi:exodeoxyribonuclease VII small subunit
MSETESNPPAQPAAIADFEKSLDELESLVARMEHGELTLEDSVKAFERGMFLYQNCQQALNEAELRVDMLLKGNDPGGRVRLDPETP